MRAGSRKFVSVGDKDIPSAGAGMAIGLAIARAMRDARAKMVNCMIAVFEERR